MPRKQKPWRTIIVAGDTGRFTWEQIDEAITKVIAQREAREARAAKRKAAAGSVGAKPTTPAPKSKARPASKQAEAAAPKAKSKRTDAGSAGKRNTERKMPSTKKPWRTLIVAGDTGRFTWDQIHAAVRAVREDKERKAASAARRGKVAGRPKVERSGSPDGLATSKGC